MIVFSLTFAEHPESAYALFTKEKLLEKYPNNELLKPWLDEKIIAGDFITFELSPPVSAFAMEVLDVLPIRTEERETFLSDIMCTMVEGGIDQWGLVRNAKKKRGKYVDNYTGFEVAEFEEEEVGTWDVTPIPPWYKVTFDTIELGIKRIIEKEVKCYVVIDVLRGSHENEAGYIDIDGADCILQAALFNEIRYS